MTIYLVFLAFTSRPISLLATYKDSVFFIVCMLRLVLFRDVITFTTRVTRNAQ